MWEAGSGFFTEYDLCAGARRQFAVSANEIRMQMSFNDVLDFQVLRRRFFDVPIDIALRIDNGCFTVRAN
jgi:hypothetical protein